MRAFFETWYPQLVRFLHVRLGDHDQAEDLAQEAFVRLLAARPRHAPAWLFTVAENLLRDHARQVAGRGRRLMLVAAVPQQGESLEAEARLLREDVAARVRRALAALPLRDRHLLLLRNDGFSYREIAERLELAPSSIGSLTTRAQRRFLQVHERLEAEESGRVASA
ncbi:MAG: sigma-70 family RNA polymerase sigma factor [Gemmatimonadetes bacterium]|nr:sigma-70 family RNA polymerase sigma factor [Gemmatimonadota bacterium]